MYLTEIHERTAGIESEIMSHENTNLIDDEIHNQIIDIKECKPKSHLDKINLKREPTGSITQKAINRQSETGIDSSTQVNQMTQDGENTIPVDSNYLHT